MNPDRGKDAVSFTQGLARVFRERHRVLKDDGVLAFTFHHKRGEAWKTVLQAILEADFFVTATYPVNAESKQSVHIYDQESVEYDVVIFCRKRWASPRITWDRLHDDIQCQAWETLQLLRQSNAKLRQVDASVVIFGKCLERYSLHYPNVFRGDERVGIDEAIAAVD